MKFILFTLLFTLSTAAHSQNALDSLRADFLTQAAEALRNGEHDEATLWIEFYSKCSMNGFVIDYKDSLQNVLDTHIRWETGLMPAAKRVRLKLFALKQEISYKSSEGFGTDVFSYTEGHLSRKSIYARKPYECRFDVYTDNYNPGVCLLYITPEKRLYGFRGAQPSPPYLCSIEGIKSESCCSKVRYGRNGLIVINWDLQEVTIDGEMFK